MKKQTEKMQIGHFIMRDNRSSALCRGGQEKGIVLSDKYYLHIDSLFTARVSKQEAMQYSKKMNFPLPTKKQIILLADNIEKINDSLMHAGLGNCMLFGDMLQEIWTCHAPADQQITDRRRVVFILPI